LNKINRGAKYLATVKHLYHNRYRFGITNTKRDITLTVFMESYLRDQYRIREFFDKVGDAGTVRFIDIGRNHGLVFFYTLDHIARRRDIAQIEYTGIDPSPLKFVYYNPKKLSFPVSYRLYDRAVVFDDSETVKLKYGENNFGNFNVSGSSHEQMLALKRNRYEFIEIEVDAMPHGEVLNLVRDACEADTIIVKIDCKNKNEVLFLDALDILSSHQGSHLVACERDGTAGRDMGEFSGADPRALSSMKIA
jgi:hypothetical protein